MLAIRSFTDFKRMHVAGTAGSVDGSGLLFGK